MANASSTYLRHLPEVFRSRPDGLAPFLGGLLKVFEALLAGRDDAGAVEGIEALIDRFPETLDAALAPLDDTAAPLRSEFLDYLASWAALTLDQNWSLEQKREWARRIMPLYRRRGTRDGLQDYLTTFVGNQVRIDEPDGGIRLGIENTTLGVDTFLADSPAYFFRVRLTYGFPPNPFDYGVWNNLQARTRAIVDLEKPAHTHYQVDARAPGFIINVRSTINVDTLIWENTVF
jgi:phage tail-like protein